jgi:hypothetical protein
VQRLEYAQGNLDRAGRFPVVLRHFPVNRRRTGKIRQTELLQKANRDFGLERGFNMR